MHVETSRAIRTEPSLHEVDAKLGPVVAGQVLPGTYFFIEVGERTLDAKINTMLLNGQLPVSVQYLHF